MSQVLQILQAVETRIATALPGTTVHRDWRRPFEEEDLPAVVVYAQANTPQSNEAFHYGPHLRVLSIRVEVRAIGRPEEDAVDTLANSVRAAILTGADDDELGGLVQVIHWTNQQWDGAEMDQPYAACALDFDLTYFFEP